MIQWGLDGEWSGGGGHCGFQRQQGQFGSFVVLIKATGDPV